MQKYSRFSIYSLISLILSFSTLFMNSGIDNPSSSPTYLDMLGFIFLPLLAIIFATISLKKSSSRFINILLIIFSLLPIFIFVLIALSHCGFYTGKCR